MFRNRCGTRGKKHRGERLCQPIVANHVTRVLTHPITCEAEIADDSLFVAHNLTCRFAIREP